MLGHGRTTRLDYPGVESVTRADDARGRVTEVTTGPGERIASIAYRGGEQVARLVLGGAPEKAKQEKADREKAQKETDEKAAKDVADAKAKQAEEDKKKGGSTNVDPDAQAGLAGGTISPEQIEARLNGTKRPDRPSGLTTGVSWG